MSMSISKVQYTYNCDPLSVIFCDHRSDLINFIKHPLSIFSMEFSGIPDIMGNFTMGSNCIMHPHFIERFPRIIYPTLGPTHGEG